MAIKDNYTKILLNFNDSLTKDECEENIWKESGEIYLEKNLFSSPVAYFNGSGNLYLDSEEISCDSSITYEFWIYLIEGHFGFSSDRARDDTVCLCIGNEGIGYETGITSYYPGQYTVAGSREINLLSLNEWHYITLSVENGNNHYISIDGNMTYLKSNSREYPLKFLPIQLGSTPTWAYGRSNPFSFRGYIKGFRISSGIARYKNNFKCPSFPNAPGQEIAINISIPKSEKSGSYRAKNSITYFYRVLFSKVSNSEALIQVFYGKNSKDIRYSETSVAFTFYDFMNSEVILLSKANEEINKLKDYLNLIIDEINLPEESKFQYISEDTGIQYFIRQKYSSIDNTIYSCRIVLNTFFSKYSDFSNESRFSVKAVPITPDNYSQTNSLLLDLSESELSSCKLFLDSLIGSNILIPSAKYKNIKAKNGDIYYIRIIYSLGQVSDTLANINYRTTWGNTAEFKFTYSNKSFFINSGNFKNYFSVISRLGENELNKCAQMFDNISNEKIIIRRNDNSTGNIITYSETESSKRYLGILVNDSDERLYCKLIDETEIANTVSSAMLAIRNDNNKICYVSNDF